MDVEEVLKMLEASSKERRRMRSDYHLTLGDAVAQLSEIAPSVPATFDIMGTPGKVDSYRGYYSDLAFAPELSPVTVGEVLADLRAAIGNTFEGYKGGDFVMGPDTPLWVSVYGSADGVAVTGVTVIDGRAVLTTKLTKPQ